MEKNLTFPLFELGLLILITSRGTSTTAPQWQENCDIPQGDYRDLAKTTAAICAQTCQEDTTCRAAVFVSGWRKCFLKKVAKPRFNVTFYSGDRKSITAPNRDAKGKDLIRHSPVKEPAECQSLYGKNPACQSFTLIGGYDVCWLKSEPLKDYEKIFSCWIKS